MKTITVPEVGDFVTIKNIRTSDRSYNDEVWRVIAVNKTHAQLECSRNRGAFFPNKIIIQIDEYDISDASSFQRN